MKPTIHTFTVTVDNVEASVGIHSEYLHRPHVIHAALQRLFQELAIKGVTINEHAQIDVEYEERPIGLADKAY